MNENEARLKAFTDANIEDHPVEASIVRRIIRSLKEAGNPVVSVWDGEESEKVTTEAEIMALVFNLDQCHLYTETGAFVFLVLGEGWDTIADYNVSLEDALKPVNDWVDKNMT